MSRVLISLDQSTREMGAAIFELPALYGTPGRLLTALGMKVPKGSDRTEAAMAVIRPLLDEFSKRGGWVCIESVYVRQNAATSLLLAELRGRVTEAAVTRGFAVMNVTAREWSSWIGTRFAANRDEVKKRAVSLAGDILREAGVAVTLGQDVADAICQGMYALSRLKLDRLRDRME